MHLFVEIMLTQVCQEFNSTWAWEMERKSYLEMTVECKTGILKVGISKATYFLFSSNRVWLVSMAILLYKAVLLLMKPVKNVSISNPKIYCDCEIHLYSLFL